MKTVFKKNQMMIVALALVIAVAGYLNFNSKDVTDLAAGENGDSVEVMDFSYEGAEGNMDDAIVSANVEDTIAGEEGVLDDALANEDSGDSIDTESIGETVLTSASVTANFLAEAKLNREQMRAKSKEILNGIIGNEALSEDAKKDAVAALVAMTETMELEYNTEQQLGIKGFVNAVVSISENSVDVCIGQAEITDTQKAQIEDIVMRKTGCSIEEIVITTIGNEN